MKRKFDDVAKILSNKVVSYSLFVGVLSSIIKTAVYCLGMLCKGSEGWQRCEDVQIYKTGCKGLEGCHKASTDKKDSLAHGDKLDSYFFTPYIYMMIQDKEITFCSINEKRVQR